MDKLLLDALNNLSLSLENLTLALQQKSDAKSDVAGALSSSDISKKLDQILSILQSNPPKTNPNLPNPTIVPVSKSIISPAPGTFVKKPESPVVKPPVSGIQEPRESGPSFKEFSRKYLDKDQKQVPLAPLTSVPSSPSSMTIPSSGIVPPSESPKSEQLDKKPGMLRGFVEKAISTFKIKKDDDSQKISPGKDSPITDPKSNKEKIQKVQSELDSIVSQIDNIIDSKGPSFTNIIKVSKLAAEALKKEKELKNLRSQMNTVDSKVDSVSKSGIVPPKIVPPTIVPATPLTPVPSRPASGIVPPSITNVKLPDSDRKESSGNLPRIVTNISPVRRDPDLKPVNQKPIETVRPMGPVKNVLPMSVSEKNQPQIRPVPAQTPGNVATKSTSPFVMGASYMSMPVIPVAVVSFADGSTLLASSGQSRVMGKKAGVKMTSSRPSAETASRQEERSERGGLFSRRKSPSETMSRPSSETTAKESRSESGPFDSKNKKNITDGVKLLLLMAVGIVAIGLAFKIIGGVDFKSVLALAIALPLIAIAFEKISKIKVTPREVGSISLALIVMSAAILASSFLLSKVRPIGLAQAFSTIVIVGAFALIAHKMPAIFDGVAKVGIRGAVIGSFLLPVVLVALSFSIMASSYFIRNVKPIGIQQAFSTIIIGGMFAIIAKRLPALYESIGSISPGKAILASFVMPLVLIGLSFAIMASSYFIRNVKPIGIQQAFSSIIIAGTFAIISLSLGKLLRSFDGVSPGKALLAALVMPIVLIGVSYAIMKSSEFIRAVKPIGLQQAFSSIVIAATFTVLAFGVGKLLKAFDKVSPVEAATFSLLAPILLVGLSYAIMLSSKNFSKVVPIGFLNFVSSIMISAVFVVLSFGLKKMVKAFDNISIADAIKASIFIPIVFVALSYTIMKSSPFISKTKPVGWLNFISAIMISIIFVAMSFAAKFIVQNTKNISAKEMIKGGLVLVAMAVATYLASIFIGKMPRISPSQFEVFLKLTLSLVAMAAAALAIVKITQRISQQDFLKGAAVVVGVAATVMLTSRLLSLGDYKNLPSPQWVIGAGLTIATFGGVIFGASKLNKIIGFKEMIKGAVVVLVIAATIMATSLLLGMGKYSKYPTTEWSKGVGLSLLIFGIATASLGAAIALTGGLGLLALGAGILAVVSIAASIVATSELLAKGQYGVFPTDDWISGVAKTLLLFGTAVVTLGAIASGGAILEGITFGLVQNPLDAGIDAVRKVSELVVETSNTLSGGNYSSYPTTDWISGVAKTLLLFGTAVVSLGAISSGGGALEGISFGLIKNPIKAGIDAIKDISQSIVDADGILSKGNFTGGPKVEWSRGIGLALGSFSSVYKMMMGSQILSLFTGGKVGGETFTASIKSISQAIKLAGDELSSGNFTGGPKEEWAKSVGIAIGAFSQVYEMMERAQVLSFFSRGNLGVSVESFSASIKTISQGIKDASELLSTGVFTGGPDETWSKGVGLAIGAFSEVYSMLQKQKIFDLFGAGVSIESFKEAIVTISEGLKEARDQLTKEEGWTGGPTETWAKGVGQSISAFAPVFKAVSETVGLFPGPSIEEFKNAIVTISKGIIEAAGVFGDATKDAVFDLTKVPKAEWGENVGKSIQAFSPVFQYLSENTGWFTSGAEAASDLQNAIRVVALAVKDSSISLSGGKYDFKIDDSWTKSISNIFNDFIELFTNSKLDTDSETMLDQSRAIGTIASTIKNVSVTLSLGKYGTDFGKFDKTVKNLFNSFIDTYAKIQKVEISDKLLALTMRVAGNIKNVSNILFVSKLNLKIDSSYSKSIKSVFESFASIYKTVKNSKIDEKSIGLVQSVATGLSKVSAELSKGKFENKIPKSYFSELNSNVDSLLKVIKKLKGFNLGDFGKLTMAITQLKITSDKISQIKFTKIPDTWSNNISNLIVKFGDIYKKVSKLPTNFKKLNDLIYNIVLADKLLSSGKYRIFPENKWIGGVGNVITKFSSIIIDSNKRLSDSVLKSGIMKIGLILTSVAGVSKLISSGRYTNVPGDRWIDSVRKVVDKMGGISVLIDKKYNFSNIKTGLAKIKAIADTIAQVSRSLSSGKYTVFPSSEWGKGAYLSLQGFLNLKLSSGSLLDKILGKNTADIDKKKLAKVLDLIMMVDSSFSKGKFKNFPTTSWSDGVIKTLSKFSTILSLVDFSKFDKKFGKNIGLSRMVSDIGLLAKVFDKLAESLQRISSSIGLIDSGKIESIRSLTSNVVLLSLMDAGQFDRMMAKLEENSQLFGSLLGDVNTGKKGKGLPGGLSGSSKPGESMSVVKAPSSKDVKGTSPESIELNQLMKKMVELMADIAAVTGTRGSLAEYIKNKEGMKSSFNWSSDESADFSLFR